MAEKGFKRKLIAILSADVEGYSRLMGEGEEATVSALTAYRDVLATLIQQHNGKVLDSPGDNLMAEFVSVVDAVQCAVAVQKEINARNTELPENRKVRFPIDINLGDVIQEKERILEAYRKAGIPEHSSQKHPINLSYLSKTTIDRW
jgi:adenylate cyclase